MGSVPCSQEPPHTEGDASSTASLSVTTGIDKIDFCGLRAVGQISSLVGLLTLWYMAVLSLNGAKYSRATFWLGEGMYKMRTYERVLTERHTLIYWYWLPAFLVDWYAVCWIWNNFFTPVHKMKGLPWTLKSDSYKLASHHRHSESHLSWKLYSNHVSYVLGAAADGSHSASFFLSQRAALKRFNGRRGCVLASPTCGVWVVVLGISVPYWNAVKGSSFLVFKAALSHLSSKNTGWTCRSNSRKRR